MSLVTKQSKLRRGWILHILRKYLHGEGNDKVLQAGLSDADHEVSMPTLHDDLEYLESKGYVELRKPSLLETPFEMMGAKITAKGIDLLEGSIKDVGIDFSHLG